MIYLIQFYAYLTQIEKQYRLGRVLIPAFHWNCGYQVISLWNKIKLSFVT